MGESASSARASMLPFFSPWVLSLVVGIVAYATATHAPLQSERPTADSAVLEPYPASVPEISAAHARLWEDPLLAALAHDRLLKADKPSEIEAEKVRACFGKIIHKIQSAPSR